MEAPAAPAEGWMLEDIEEDIEEDSEEDDPVSFTLLAFFSSSSDEYRSAIAFALAICLLFLFFPMDFYGATRGSPG